jgi:hypothetical protein
MRRYSLLAAVFVVLAVSTTRVRGQQASDNQVLDRFMQQQRQLDDELQQQRRGLTPLESLLDWQFGGWIDYYLFHFDDGLQSSRFSQRPGLAVWTRLRMDNGAP